MHRRTLLKTSFGVLLAITLANHAGAQDMDDTTQASLDTVMAFMEAMGSGDMETMSALMADDMVWHNEGDKRLPWIGPGEGKKEILSFHRFSARTFRRPSGRTAIHSRLVTRLQYPER